MRKISGQLISSKPVSLSRAAKHINQFASVDNGSSAAVALYLQRTADAFNHLVQFHKRSKNVDVQRRPSRKRARKSETEMLEKNPDEKTAKDSGIRGKRDKKTVNVAAEANPNEDDMKKSKIKEKEQIKAEKKKKKRKDEDS